MRANDRLTSLQCDNLRSIAGLMIPPDPAHGMPGADDPAIQAEILATLGRDASAVCSALDLLADLSGKSLAALDTVQRDEVVAAFRTTGGAAVATLSRVILQCYYRDDRVLQSLNLELRAPFPTGHQLEQGDWSLLEPVKARPASWRRAP